LRDEKSSGQDYKPHELNTYRQGGNPRKGTSAGRGKGTIEKKGKGRLFLRKSKPAQMGRGGDDSTESSDRTIIVEIVDGIGFRRRRRTN